MKLKLGVKAKDKITDFEGIVIGHSQWLTGCDQWCIKPKAKNNEVKDGLWFDEGQIEVLDEGINKKEVKSNKNGGPRMDVPSA